MCSSGPRVEFVRRRAPHKKSRNGCRPCKQRKVRCDESKPICLGCLLRGTDCQYLSGTPKLAPKSRKSPTVVPIVRSLPRLLPANPADPFRVMPVEMNYRSPEVFYYFVENRNLLAAFTYEDKSLFTSRFGLAETNATWFQMTLCISAAYRSLYKDGSFQETFLHHRQSLLKWLQEQLRTVTDLVPVPCLSSVATLILVDSAFGDDTGVKSHLSGLLSLLEAKRLADQKSWFYDRLLKKVVMMALCLIFTVRSSQLSPKSMRQNRPTKPQSTIWGERVHPLVPSMYTQMVNEYLRSPLITGVSDTVQRTDGGLLTWWHQTLQKTKSKSLGQLTTSSKASYSDLKHGEIQKWKTAISVYALTVGSIDWANRTRDKRIYVVDISKDLASLRAWSDEIVQQWIVCGEPMTQTIAQQILKKVSWLESDQNLRLRAEITRL